MPTLFGRQHINLLSTMKKFLLLTIITVFPFTHFAQIDANSVMGLPKATDNTEMNGISGAAEGSFLYNIAQKNIYFYNGTAWVGVSASGSNLYTANGALTGARTLNGSGNALSFSNLASFQLNTTGTTQLLAAGSLRLESTGSTTQINSALGLTLTATNGGVTINGNTTVNNNLTVYGALTDSTGSSGRNGQILSSTTTGTDWIDLRQATVENKTVNYTLSTNDNGKVFTFSSTTSITLTVPNGLPVGFNISIYQTNTGQVTVKGARGVTILNRLSRFKTAGLHAGAGLICTSTNNFHLTGDLKR
jgi:hypothetical protein